MILSEMSCILSTHLFFFLAACFPHKELCLAIFSSFWYCFLCIHRILFIRFDILHSTLRFRAWLWCDLVVHDANNSIVRFNIIMTLLLYLYTAYCMHSLWQPYQIPLETLKWNLFLARFHPECTALCTVHGVQYTHTHTYTKPSKLKTKIKSTLNLVFVAHSNLAGWK